jgi:hypothetical protein
MYFDKEPLYPFGHGLSYTNFHYDNLKLSKKTANPTDKVDVIFTVKNIGHNQKWDSQTVPIITPSEVHDVYFKFYGDFKLSWFAFK